MRPYYFPFKMIEVSFEAYVSCVRPCNMLKARRHVVGLLKVRSTASSLVRLGYGWKLQLGLAPSSLPEAAPEGPSFVSCVLRIVIRTCAQASPQPLKTKYSLLSVSRSAQREHATGGGSCESGWPALRVPWQAAQKVTTYPSTKSHSILQDYCPVCHLLYQGIGAENFSTECEFFVGAGIRTFIPHC